LKVGIKDEFEAKDNEIDSKNVSNAVKQVAPFLKEFDET
jgi:hypothetical protein